MAKDEEFEPVREHKLLGQQNYFEWRRFLERTAKSMEVWEILLGTEKVLEKPKTEDHVVMTEEEPTINPRATRSKTAAAAEDKSATEAEKPAPPPKPQVDSVRSMLQYNAAYMD